MFNYIDIGKRLKAYRMGAALKAEDVARALGVSRTAIYRLEQGQIVKLDVLERLADLLGATLPSLLGIEVEYYAGALAFFERMRQIEETSKQIVSHFEPVSFLLTSDGYTKRLRAALIESLPAAMSNRAKATKRIDSLIAVLDERKESFVRRRPSITNIIGTREIERFVHIGLIGRLDVPPARRRESIDVARAEVEHIASLMEQEPIGIQIGVVDDNMPNVTFQIFRETHGAHLAVSPFRLGELPNVRTGIATVTASPEAIELYRKMVEDLWSRARKGRTGAALLRRLAKNA